MLVGLWEKNNYIKQTILRNWRKWNHYFLHMCTSGRLWERKPDLYSTYRYEQVTKATIRSCLVFPIWPNWLVKTGSNHLQNWRHEFSLLWCHWVTTTKDITEYHRPLQPVSIMTLPKDVHITILHFQFKPEKLGSFNLNITLHGCVSNSGR